MQQKSAAHRGALSELAVGITRAASSSWSCTHNPRFPLCTASPIATWRLRKIDDIAPQTATKWQRRFRASERQAGLAVRDVNRLEEWAGEGLEAASSDAEAALLSTATDEPMCRYCGCWEGDACLMPDGSGCSWFKPAADIAESL
jgi:hypothetical protein